MSRRISFKLYGEEWELVQAFANYCRVELGVDRPVDELLKKLILKYLFDNIDREKSTPGASPAIEQSEMRVNVSGVTNDLGQVVGELDAD